VSTADPPELSDAEKAMAQRFGMTADEYVNFRQLRPDLSEPDPEKENVKQAVREVLDEREAAS
jgi:hypothetical protein